MSKIPVFVGLDYHQSAVQVCVLSATGEQLCNRSTENDVGAIRRLVERYGPPERVAIESCCGAADLADQLNAQAGWPVSLCHPGVVSRMKMNPDKHDCGDAYVVADLVRLNYLPRVWLPPEWIRQLRQTVRYRQQLVAERKRHKQQVSALVRQQRLGSCEATTWTKKWLQWLRALPWPRLSRVVVEGHLRQVESLNVEIRGVEETLKQELEQDGVARWLQTQTGIGLVTAATLRAEIGDVTRFRTGKQLARFCGLSPRNASSGVRQADAGLIRACNPELKRVLIEAAHRLVHRDPHWTKLAIRLKKAGKPTCVAIGAVANRWVRQLFHPWKELHAPAA
jgi:transposase